ncbi:MAG: hypothetical protein ACJ0BD_03070 [Gammaproteobacteria bacterium]|tara:strand:- start:317 stop:781 length:465 start_codon:yes stop_codon:yes gene_type:complete
MDWFLQNISVIIQAAAALGALGTVFFLIREMAEQNRVSKANVRQNVADSHQKMALAGMTKDIVQIKIKLRKDEPLTEEEDAMYLSYFAVMLRSRENQYYQYTIGMLDESEWASFLKSFKTLFKSPHHLKLWSFMRETFDSDFVLIVDDLIEEGK